MNARIFTAATVIAVFCGALPTVAADAQMLQLVMPDAKVVAGVNVEQAKASAFGQWVLAQIAPQDKDLQQLNALIGFDPRRDVRELLVASNAAEKKDSGLVLARGAFDPAKITALAAQHGAVGETYKGIVILSDQSRKGGIAFASATLAIIGDPANVRAAIDRLASPSSLPVALNMEIGKWSTTQDAWAVALSPLGLMAGPGGPQIGALTQQTAFQSIQRAAVGVKFGADIALTAQAVADTPDNATAMEGVLKLLTNLAQTQTSANPGAVNLIKALQVNAQGNVVNIALSLPMQQFLELVQKPQRAQVQRRPSQK